MTGPDTDTAVILLAAGRSERFGSDKLTADFRGHPLWEWAAIAAEGAGFTHRFIVTAPDNPFPLRKGWESVPNAHATQGMGTSIAAGAKAASRFERLLVILADMPFVDPSHLLLLARADGPVFTDYGDKRRGCPAAFPRSAFAALQALHGDEGARHLELGGATSIAPRDPAILIDLDTVQDLQRHRDISPPAGDRQSRSSPTCTCRTMQG